MCTALKIGSVDVAARSVAPRIHVQQKGLRQAIDLGQVFSNPTKDTNRIHLFAGTEAMQAIDQGEIRTQASVMALYRGRVVLGLLPIS